MQRKQQEVVNARLMPTRQMQNFPRSIDQKIACRGNENSSWKDAALITPHNIDDNNAKELTSYEDPEAELVTAVIHISDREFCLPLAAPFDELIQHHGHVREHEATNVEAKELGGVAR
jgi:hypothetical protein